ncbi:MAG: DUF3822 family protein [Prevotellaceae bacterium]|jgi:hypothetical protein|nr:DUF3822 family protein [Prevotellaceae bacterium]
MSYLINKRIDFTKSFLYRLSIQADLSGFSFAILNDHTATCLQLLRHSFAETFDHNDIYSEVTTLCKKFPQLKARFSSVQCVWCAPFFTLIPSSSFVPDKAAYILQSMHSINDLDEVYFYPLPQFDAICIYSVPNSITAPLVKNQPTIRFFSIAPLLIQAATPLFGHTRVLFHYQYQTLYLTLMRDKELLLCNAYQAPEFTNALYFLFFALRQWQLNPESLRLYINGQISKQNRQLLHNYFPLISILSDSAISLPSSEYALLYNTILHQICVSSEAL